MNIFTFVWAFNFQISLSDLTLHFSLFLILTQIYCNSQPLVCDLYYLESQPIEYWILSTPSHTSSLKLSLNMEDHQQRTTTLPTNYRYLYISTWGTQQTTPRSQCLSNCVIFTIGYIKTSIIYASPAVQNKTVGIWPMANVIFVVVYSVANI